MRMCNVPFVYPLDSEELNVLYLPAYYYFSAHFECRNLGREKKAKLFHIVGGFGLTVQTAHAFFLDEPLKTAPSMAQAFHDAHGKIIKYCKEGYVLCANLADQRKDATQFIANDIAWGALDDT